MAPGRSTGHYDSWPAGGADPRPAGQSDNAPKDRMRPASWYRRAIRRAAVFPVGRSGANAEVLELSILRAGTVECSCPCAIHLPGETI